MADSPVAGVARVRAAVQDLLQAVARRRRRRPALRHEEQQDRGLAERRGALEVGK